MDERNFFSLFNNLKNVMRCPSCNSVYQMSEMQYVGKHEGYFLLSMNCSKCSLPVWVNVFSGPVPEDRPTMTDLTIGDARFLNRPPINMDEVIEFSTFVRGFDGNFSKAFK